MVVNKPPFFAGCAVGIADVLGIGSVAPTEFELTSGMVLVNEASPRGGVALHA